MKTLSALFLLALVSSPRHQALAFLPPMGHQQSNYAAKATTTTTTTTTLEATRIGFLGCGVIASAIATGIATQNEVPIESIAVTKRSEAKSTALKKAFPDLVSVYEDNQEIVDQSDFVFVCVLPKQASELLQSLKFDNDRHNLISLVSTAKVPELIQDSRLDPEKVSKMICLPCIARHQGVALHCAPAGANPELTKLFNAAGGVVTCDTEEEMNILMVTTCIMGPIYGTMKSGRDWLVQQGVDVEKASYLITKQYLGGVQEAGLDIDDPNRLDGLIAEQTAGGLNAQALDNLDKLGGLDAQQKIMDKILERIRGDSDGSI